MLSKIASDLKTIHFSESQHKLFKDHLSNIEKNTLVFPVDNASQLALNDRFKTISGGYKLSWQALRQACGFLCNGLYTVVSNMSVNSSTNKKFNEAYSDYDACVLYNTFVRRRFNTHLLGKKAIKNNQTGTLDCLVGPRYQRLPNFELLEKIEKVFKSFGESYTFFRSSISGRKMQARFAFCEPMTLDSLGHSDVLSPVRVGLLFSNSESGDSSVKVTLFMSFGNVGSTMVPYTNSWCLDHKGKDFSARLSSLLKSVQVKRLEITETKVADMLSSLYCSRLPISEGTINLENWASEFKRKMAVNKVNGSTSRRVLQRFMYSQSGDGSLRTFNLENKIDINSKTALDVFIALLAEGNNGSNSLTVRDHLEQSSFRLLSGKMRL